MITPNDALQFIKDHHNGEIPYMFGKNEYARWMAEFANYTVTKHLHKLGVSGPASAVCGGGELLATEAEDTGVSDGHKHDFKYTECSYRFKCSCGKYEDEHLREASAAARDCGGC